MTNQKLRDLAEFAVKEEINLNRIHNKYKKERFKRDAGGLLGAALGASAGIPKRFGRFRAPAAIGLGVTGLVGGMAAGHALAKAQNPQFAKAFNEATTEHQDAIYDYVNAMSKKSALENIKEAAFADEIEKIAGSKLKTALKVSAIAGGGVGVGYLSHALKDKLYGKNRKSIINPSLFK